MVKNGLQPSGSEFKGNNFFVNFYFSFSQKNVIFESQYGYISNPRFV